MDPEPLIRILIFFTHPDPRSCNLKIVNDNFVVKSLKKNKKYYSVADPDLIFYPSQIPDPKKAPDPGSWIRNNVSDNFLEKKLKKSLFFLTIFFLLQMTLTSQLA